MAKDILDLNTELDEDTQKDRYLTFNLGDEVYGLDICYVTEIIGILPITKVPEMPVFIKGIVNLRGKIIPVMDVRIKFKKEPIDYNERTCIIFVDIDDVALGLIVDSVAEVTNIAEGDIVPPPSSSTGFSNRYIKGIGKVGNEVVLLLECRKILNEDELEILADV